MLNIRDIVSHTLANGGGTFPPVKDGYMVGGVVPEVVTEPAKFETVLGEFIDGNGPILARAHLGTWVNGGKVHIDVSERADNREEAVRLARERGELAFYDIRNRVSIPTK